MNFPGSIAKKTLSNRDISENQLRITTGQTPHIHTFAPNQRSVVLTLAERNSATTFEVQFSQSGKVGYFDGPGWDLMLATYQLKAGDRIGFFRSSIELTVDFEVHKHELRDYQSVVQGVARCARVRQELITITEGITGFLDPNSPKHYRQNVLKETLQSCRIQSRECRQRASNQQRRWNFPNSKKENRVDCTNAPVSVVAHFPCPEQKRR